ncbi:Zinc finger protein 268 [Manis javanica]|nr:Zinc finger protein 268 [Manis javanica]
MNVTCGKAFIWKSLLIVHERTHAGENPYKCSQCEKSFSGKLRLIVHQRMHTREKPYECSDCEKAFIRKSQLIVHQRTHSGEKPYGCNECGKNLSEINSQCNQRTHTGEKPCKCTECGKAFCWKSQLIMHQRIHADEKRINELNLRNSKINSQEIAN